MEALKDETLAQVVGGKTTQEAEDWWSRNEKEILARAPSYLKSLSGLALNYVRGCEEVYGIAECKAALKSFGVDVDNLY